MNRDVFTSYLKECLLEVKQTPFHVSDLPKKPAIRDKIEPLSFRRVGLENEQLGVMWFKYLIMLFGTKKC